MDVNLKDSSDFTPVMYACEHNNIELLKLLVQHGGDIHIINNEGVTCMLLAIINSLPSVVQYLLENKFDVTNNCGSHCSYITDAAYLNDIKILVLLIEAGCDINQTKQDESGVILNPLWAAVEKTNVNIVEELLMRGAKTIVREDLNMTAMHCCAMAQSECLPIAKLLYEYKCPINLRSTQAGETPIFLACNSGFNDIVDYLLELGVDPNDCSPLSRTCFQQSFFRNHKGIIQSLIKRGYQLTEDDRQDLNMFIMDLYQDYDVEMLNFFITNNIVTKQQILDAISQLYKWAKESDSISNDDKITEEQEQQDKNGIDPMGLLPINMDDLKLNIEPKIRIYPKTIEQLQIFLDYKPSKLSNSNSSLNELN
jgi:ankyrin repeat protein